MTDALNAAYAAVDALDTEWRARLQLSDAATATDAATIATLQAQVAALTANNPPPSTMPLQTAIASDAIVDAYSVQVFPTYRHKVYGQDDAVYGLLKDLGVRHVRVTVSDQPESVAFLRRIRDTLGVTAHGTCGAFEDTAAANLTNRKAIETYVKAQPDLWLRLAGFNEPQGIRFGPVPTDWATRTVDQQKWLHGLGATVGVQVAGPALSNGVKTLRNDWLVLGRAGLAQWCNRIAIHLYPAGVAPSQNIDERSGWARDGLGNLPVDCTEGGYSTGSIAQAGNPVPEAVQAVYAPRHLLEWVKRGGWLNQFELLDDPGVQTNRNNTLGMVACGSVDPATWRKKPAFAAVKALLAACADPGPAFTPKPLPLQVIGGDDVRWILTGRRDGTYRLLLWRDVNVYDTSTHQPIVVLPKQVSVIDATGSNVVTVGAGVTTVAVS